MPTRNGTFLDESLQKQQQNTTQMYVYLHVAVEEFNIGFREIIFVFSMFFTVIW